MSSYRDTGLYRRALGARDGEPDPSHRDRLRVALDRFRERAGVLAARIATDLPGFTGHDVQHIDALWETADAIVGDSYELTPTEAFVFGGAALLHDLGLTVAAYLDGPETVETGEDWADHLSMALRKQLNREPSRLELENPSESARLAAREGVLRMRHARRAADLATQSLRGPDGQIYLLDDDDLRSDLGWLIGQIAASHGSDTVELSDAFNTSPTPKDFPRSWKVDSLSLACLLRCADAAQLDGRRARALQQAIQRPHGVSADHWNFQRWLHPAYQSDGRLIFDSTRPFPRTSADAWWLAFDWLRMADNELRAVDALLGDKRPDRRFAARAIASVDSPTRMAERIRTDGWLPVDARLHVSSVVELARRLGGRQLYGKAAAVPLRELLQNAMDAVRARRLLQDDRKVGSVTVKESQEGDSLILEVCDQGVGMTPEALSGPLLDFGNSLWRSEGVATHLPGLAGRGFRSYGRFGIGFFAAFMWSEDVQVCSRSYLGGVQDTHVLAFSDLSRRPVLRVADPSEHLSEPGTAVRLRLPSASLAGVDARLDPDSSLSDVSQLVPWLAPSAEIDLHVQGSGKPRRVVRAHDWRTMAPPKLMQRILGNQYHSVRDNMLELIGANMRPIEQDGEIVGRGALIPATQDQLGVLTVEGLRARTYDSFAGILIGEDPNVARTEARPIATKETLRAWAAEQAALLGASPYGNEVDLFECAEMVAKCGTLPDPLPVCFTAEGPLSVRDLRVWASRRDRAFILDIRDTDDISMMDAEILEPVDGILVIPWCRPRMEWYENAIGSTIPYERYSLVVDTLEEAWGDIMVGDENLDPVLVGYGDAGREVFSRYCERLNASSVGGRPIG
jgi:hypothetical protein